MKSYRSTFEENFKPVKEPADNKKGYRIRYVYIGNWHVWRAERAVIKRTKGLIAFLFVLSVMIFLLGALVDSRLNASRFVALPGTMAIAAMLIEAFGMVQFCFAGEKLTCQDFQDVDTKLTLGAFFHAALLVWASAAAAIGMIGREFLPGDLLAALSFAASAVLAGGVLWFYRALPQGIEANNEADC